MIVYGDPKFTVAFGTFVNRLADLLRQAADAAEWVRRGADPSVARESATRLLIACGQCEQAVEDAIDAGGGLADCRAAMMRITDAAADLLSTCGRRDEEATAEKALAACRSSLDELAAAPDALPLPVKVPEGYAFYRLIPEQYALAARRWFGEHSRHGLERVTVLGLRSIGTSLSAVVAAALRQGARAGLSVCRATARPHGPPFERRVTLPDELRASDGARVRCVKSEWALVVDEGPGLSGSSMAAAYEALVEQGGFDPERIALLPGHDGMPGAQGGEAVRRVWAGAPRYVAAPDEMQRDRLAVKERLCALSAALSPSQAGPDVGAARGQLHDIGGGAWRGFAYGPNCASWPAAAPQFERPKFLWRRDDEEIGGIVWVFAGYSEVDAADYGGVGGLASRELAAARRMTALAGAGWTVPALAVAEGFVASRWVEGERLNAGGAAGIGQDRVDLLADYCAAASCPPLSELVEREAWQRLREMLVCNAREACGESAGAVADELAGLAEGEAETLIGTAPSYGDGRIGPWEWVREAGGEVVKTDCAGHEMDHTAVGRQPVWWDLAGAAVEWRLTADQRAALWRRAQEKLGITGEKRIAAGSRLERFYRAAYAAFRLGMLAIAGLQNEVGGDDHDEEAQRRRQAALAYTRELHGALGS